MYVTEIVGLSPIYYGPFWIWTACRD